MTFAQAGKRATASSSLIVSCAQGAQLCTCGPGHGAIVTVHPAGCAPWHPAPRPGLEAGRPTPALSAPFGHRPPATPAAGNCRTIVRFQPGRRYCTHLDVCIASQVTGGSSGPRRMVTERWIRARGAWPRQRAGQCGAAGRTGRSPACRARGQAPGRSGAEAEDGTQCFYAYPDRLGLGHAEPFKYIQGLPEYYPCRMRALGA